MKKRIAMRVPAKVSARQKDRTLARLQDRAGALADAAAALCAVLEVGGGEDEDEPSCQDCGAERRKEGPIAWTEHGDRCLVGRVRARLGELLEP